MTVVTEQAEGDFGTYFDDEECEGLVDLAPISVLEYSDSDDILLW